MMHNVTSYFSVNGAMQDDVIPCAYYIHEFSIDFFGKFETQKNV